MFPARSPAWMRCRKKNPFRKKKNQKRSDSLSTDLIPGSMEQVHKTGSIHSTRFHSFMLLIVTRSWPNTQFHVHRPEGYISLFIQSRAKIVEAPRGLRRFMVQPFFTSSPHHFLPMKRFTNFVFASRRSTINKPSTTPEKSLSTEKPSNFPFSFK